VQPTAKKFRAVLPREAAAAAKKLTAAGRPARATRSQGVERLTCADLR
jgi:hypothetical protein